MTPAAQEGSDPENGFPSCPAVPAPLPVLFRHGVPAAHGAAVQFKPDNRRGEAAGQTSDTAEASVVIRGQQLEQPALQDVSRHRVRAAIPDPPAEFPPRGAAVRFKAEDRRAGMHGRALGVAADPVVARGQRSRRHKLSRRPGLGTCISRQRGPPARPADDAPFGSMSRSARARRRGRGSFCLGKRGP